MVVEAAVGQALAAKVRRCQTGSQELLFLAGPQANHLNSLCPCFPSKIDVGDASTAKFTGSYRRDVLKGSKTLFPFLELCF